MEFDVVNWHVHQNLKNSTKEQFQEGTQFGDYVYLVLRLQLNECKSQIESNCQITFFPFHCLKNSNRFFVVVKICDQNMFITNRM